MGNEITAWNRSEKEKMFIKRVSLDLPVLEKLKILSDAAKYDVACTSSGVAKKNPGAGIGNATEAGICHSFSADGRCISLLKILFTNECIYNCKYCINRVSNDVVRTTRPQKVIIACKRSKYQGFRTFCHK